MVQWSSSGERIRVLSRLSECFCQILLLRQRKGCRSFALTHTSHLAMRSTPCRQLSAGFSRECLSTSVLMLQTSVCAENSNSGFFARSTQYREDEVSTYKLIASHLGIHNGARAVGNALANNPFPLIVPCHRAIRSDYDLSGYQGGIGMKRSLLTKEGIVFDDSGRVRCSCFHYGQEDRKTVRTRTENPATLPPQPVMPALGVQE